MFENVVLAGALKLGARYGIFPVQVGGEYDKAPAVEVHDTHTLFRERVPSELEIYAWWKTPRYGIGLHCGQQGLSCIDFDDADVFSPWKDAVIDNGGEDILSKLAYVKTRFGYHAWYRCPEKPLAVQKLARWAAPRYHEGREKDVRTRIELRGVGSYAVAPPTPGYSVMTDQALMSPDLCDLPALTLEEQELLMVVAAMFDEEEAPEPAYSAPKAKQGEVRPGDWFNETADWRTLIEGAGGTYVKMSGQRMLFRRPGKRKAYSLTTGNGRAGQDLVKMHTDNWPPFEQGKTYDKFFWYATLNHRGNAKEAAKAIAQMDGFPKAEPRPAAESSSKYEFDGELPMIEVNNRQTRDITTDAFSSIMWANKPERFFVRSGHLARVMRDEADRAELLVLDGDSMASVLRRTANWHQTDKKGVHMCDPPVSVVKDIQSLKPWPGVPKLETLHQCPVLAPNGSMRLEPGYHAPAMAYVATNGAWKPAAATGADAARWILDEVLSDFPFAEDASKAHALTLMLLPFVRPCISGTTPLHLIDAPKSGSGKGKLATVCLIPGIGYVGPTTLPKDEESLRKMITTALLVGKAAIILDNIKKRVESEALESILTSEVWEDRMLGSNTWVSVPNKCAWVATSNNAKLSPDVTRRSLYIRLDPGREDPENRDGFKHDPIGEWALESRMLIGAACLAMVAEWAKQGMPDGKPRFGSHERWAKVMGGILEVCGVKGFLANQAVLRDKANDEDETWRTLLQMWHERFSEDPVTVKELYEAFSDSEALQALAGNSTDPVNQRKTLGKLLGNRLDTVYSHFRICKATMNNGNRRFKLSQISGFEALESEKLTPRVSAQARSRTHDVRTEDEQATKAITATDQVQPELGVSGLADPDTTENEVEI